MARDRKIRVGLDFDGVVAYNPFRIIRAPVKWFKRTFFKQRGVKFLVPHTSFQRLMWTLMHETSIFPARGITLLKEMAKDDRFEFYLITARYSFLRDNLDHWLDRHKIRTLFKQIHSNMKDEQPHVYKLQKVEELKLDVFVEDNWDIVHYVSERSKTRILWIYNIFDRNVVYNHKFPYLEKALENVIDEAAI